MRLPHSPPVLWLWPWLALASSGILAYPNSYPQQQLVTYVTTSMTSSQRSQSANQQLKPAFVYDSPPPEREEGSSFVHPLATTTSDVRNEKTRPANKVIGSSASPAVSVVFDGNEPKFTDALGHKVPKPQPSLQVASPIVLLNPDRYEFFTFDENGELVKRLMTMQEIQSIVANGDGEGPSIINPPALAESNPDKNVQDIVNSVQNVLNKEAASSSSKNSSGELLPPLLDTPDVSSSWSLILPAIFGNSGGDIFPQQRPQHIIMTPESELLETSTKAPSPLTVATKKAKPAKRKPPTNRKPATTTSTTQVTPQVVQEELDPMESVYTGIQQYQQAAANMPEFQPLKMQPESTTRRVFFNNQEIIHTSTSSSSAPLINEIGQLAKNPVGVHRKPIQPQHEKEPNGGAESTSQATGEKQKVKKKKTTTTTTTTTPALQHEIDPLNQKEPVTKEKTTKTTQAPRMTTIKKKKRKPTRAPGTGTFAGSSKPSKTKRKPTSAPQAQIFGNQHSSNPQRPIKKHKPSTTSTMTPLPQVSTTSTAIKPVTISPEAPTTEPTAESPITPTPETQHPTTIPITAEASTITSTEAQTTPIEAIITTTTATTIASVKNTTISPMLHHQKLHNRPDSRPLTQHHNQNHAKPAHITTTELSNIAWGVQADSYGLVNVISSSSTTHKPYYPLPNYNSNVAQNVTSMFSAATGLFSPLKKTPLPSLAQLQHQLHSGSLSSAPQLSPAQIVSMEKIMQTLTQDHSTTDKGGKNAAESPQRHESAESKLQMEAMLSNEKVAMMASTTPEKTTATATEVLTTSSKPITILTSSKPLIFQYGVSTLATNLSEEVEDSTESNDSTKVYQQIAETTLSSLEDNNEQQNPFVVITARPQYFTRKPEPMQTIKTNQTPEELETTELPRQTQFTVTTPMSPLEELDTITDKPVVESVNAQANEPNLIGDDNPQSVEAEKVANLTITTIGETLRLPVSESSTVSDFDSTEVTPKIADLVHQLNLEMLRPTDRIYMANFQTQAATVASTLVDGSNSVVSDVPINLSETKDELEFLMSDVIQLISQESQNNSTFKDLPMYDLHRLNNFGKLNTSFLLQSKPEPNESYKQESQHSTYAADYSKTESTYSESFSAVETSSLIPILSLSQIYAQQQQDEDKEHQDFFNEKLKKQPSSEPFRYGTGLAIENAFTTIPTVDATETDNVKPVITTERQQAEENSHEVTTSKEEGSNSEKPTTTISNIPERYTHSDSEEEMTELLTNGYSEHQMTEKEPEPISITLEESASTAQLPESKGTTLVTNVYLNAQKQDQSLTKVKQGQIAAMEDSFTNAAQVLPQYMSSTSEDPEKLEVSVTENSDDRFLTSSHLDMSLSSEQVTKKIELSTVKSLQLSDESIEDISDELTAIISEENDADEEEAVTSAQKIRPDDEDPYVKLGETTANVVRPLTTNSEEVGEDKNVTKPEEDNYMLPLPSYGQQAGDQADEEDDEDQVISQVPFSLPSRTRKTTTTKPTTEAPTSTTSFAATSTSPPTTKRINTLKPVSYYVQPSLLVGYNEQDLEPLKKLSNNASKVDPAHSQVQSTMTHQRPTQRPLLLTNLMASSTQSTRPPVKLAPNSESSQGLEASTALLDEDLQSFAKLCNELAFSYWRAITSEKISSARSLVMSPFALTSMLSMVFLGARGSTSGEMNEILKLDDMVTFNPHLILRNITNSVEQATDSNIATAAFVREIFSDRSNGKILPFFREKIQQLYAGHVEEVNFHVVNDIVRRRTNLLIKRHTMGKVLEYLRTNSVWVNGPIATVSANLFQTDCVHGSTADRDGEMFFQVHPTVRQRRLVRIPAVLYRSGFLAGYEHNLDATVVALGRIQDTVSTIYVMPGYQNSISPMDNLERLERSLVEKAFGESRAWSRLLTSLIDRPGMEVQLPRFSHRSFVNSSAGLQKMGLRGLFKSDLADLRGLTGGSRDIFLSDMIQINTFSTCGEEKVSDHHHVEMYPAPPLRKQNKDVDAINDAFDSSEAVVDFGSSMQESTLGRGFYDDLLDPKYLELPLPLRPRQARVPDAPRLRFDKPFLYFVRHNPTGIILFMGRFQPRLLP
ncbi:uncharacterized protein LOC108030944 [Drosophila biarmipes]|uniref:uncharacterized protein LOC108030944 n=1 Tax=Drosophila biarmipes TaxID=125945 RepID=UPI0007E877BB|nr:uncharacterized protein LOC108030944 [Drosophila biarmipes]XP_050743518.1 uncharacterized protein LOC108030944 [Drosophila biarmipes]XP_050743519.1 uncharacterized protein LOC108030944 [Drosophila biarmipes]